MLCRIWTALILWQRKSAGQYLVIDHQRKIRGFNTMVLDFLSHLTELNFDLRGKRVAILGAGGTTRAIISVLCLLPKAKALSASRFITAQGQC